MKLMIVDDSNIIRNKIERTAAKNSDADFTVVGMAKNGIEAVQLFKDESPDVVTMDLTMPEMDGIECIENLVEIDNKALILVVSALADKATAIEALKKGAHGFLCKPFTDGELQDALYELVKRAS